MADSETFLKFERILADWATGSGQAVTCCMEFLMFLFTFVQISASKLILAFNQYTDKLSCTTHSYEWNMTASLYTD